VRSLAPAVIFAAALALVGATATPAHAQARGGHPRGRPHPKGGHGPSKGGQGAPPATVDLARARTLDKEGVKAYGEGRYNDAIRFFEEAHRLGGPPFELWNIAKCHLRLDQPERAAEMFERYLATQNLPPDDRAEATQQLESLRKRPSTLTVSSTPPGAIVAIDGSAEESRTPMSTTVPPGPHKVTVTLDDHPPWSQEVEAKYGRAIIVDAPLSKGDDDGERKASSDKAFADLESRRIALRTTLGMVFPRWGGVGGGAQVGFTVSGTYRVADLGKTQIGVGGLFFVTPDSWKNTIGATGTADPCGTLVDATSATALSFYLLGTAGWELVPRLRLHGMFGLGSAVYATGNIGGDVFVQQCSPDPGMRPTFLFGSQLDYAITPAVRLTAMPITFQLQPSFASARSVPVDATGLWLRASIAFGVGVDL